MFFVIGDGLLTGCCVSDAGSPDGSCTLLADADVDGGREQRGSADSGRHAAAGGFGGAARGGDDNQGMGLMSPDAAQAEFQAMDAWQGRASKGTELSGFEDWMCS